MDDLPIILPAALLVLLPATAGAWAVCYNVVTRDAKNVGDGSGQVLIDLDPHPYALSSCPKR